MKNVFILNNNIYVFLFFYFSLILGFIFNESLNSGVIQDWETNKLLITDFSSNFIDTLLSYDNYGSRHSPINNIILSVFYKIGFSLSEVRLINLHFSLILILGFYQCLKIKFNHIDNRILQLLSFLVFLSPTFRSLSIWPDSRITGLIFIVYSIYFFLKFNQSHKLHDVFFCIFALIISSYISPNFSVFSVFFYLIFFKNLNFKNFLYIIFFSIILSTPMIYYVFFLDINFIVAGHTPGYKNNILSLDFNIFNKVLLITSIYVFHLLPVIFLSVSKIDFLNFIKKYLILILIFWIMAIYFFDYKINFTGGGVIFQISRILFENNFVFFVLSFFILVIIGYIVSLSKINFSLLGLSILSNIQNTIYHKYYEPFFLIITFLLFKNIDFKRFFFDKKGIFYLYLWSILYIFLRVSKNLLL